MKTIAIVISRNQNEVTTSEAEKIRKAVKKSYGRECKARIFKNEDMDDMMASAARFDGVAVFHTKDVNGDVWAEYDSYVSTWAIDSSIDVIPLN